MKKYAILTLLSLSNFLGAQYAADNNDHTQNHGYYPYPANSDISHQDKKSTPSKDAKDQNDLSKDNTQGASNQEKKSAPSQDGDKAEEKNDKSEKKEKDSNQKEELDKKEEGKKEEEKPKSPHTFTSNVSLVSDYRFRGISQTMRRPAIQGGFDYSHASGVYLGTWASNVDGTTHFYNNTSMEWDFYGGYKGKFFPCSIPDVAYNIGLIYYYYPGGKTNSSHSVRYNTGEFYIELTYKRLSVKYWQTLTDYFGINSDNPPFNWEKNRADRPNGHSYGSNNIEASFSFDISKKMCWGRLTGGKFNLLLVVGHQTVRHYEHLSCTHWRVTLTQEFDWFNAFISYVGTNARHAYFNVPDNGFHESSRHLGAQGVVVGVIRTF